MATANLVDVAVYSPDHRLQLVVEVHTKTKATVEWVANMRRKLFAHGVISTSPYFLLALPDKLCLWTNASSPFDVVPPEYEVDTAPLFAKYLGEPVVALEELSEFGLALVVRSWLNDVIYSNLTRETAQPDQLWLLDSGLYEAIKNGSARTEAA